MSALLPLALALCAGLALSSRSLLHAAVWLAGASALTALTLSALGAQTLAIIELSVGAGLVTILLVFAISLAGPAPAPPQTLLPVWLASVLVGVLLLFLLNPILTLPAGLPAQGEAPLTTLVWDARALDVLLQWVMLLATALTLLGFLTEPPQEKKP